MAEQYLVSCSCGDTVAVTPAQAGGKVTCACGKTLDAPTLGEMKRLPVAPQSVDSQSRSWGVRQGLIATGIIVAVLCTVPGIYWWMQPKAPARTVDAELAAAGKEIEAWSPVQTWAAWHGRYVPLANQGLDEFRTPGSVAEEKSWATLRRYQYTAFGIAGFAMLFSIAAALVGRGATKS